MNKPRIAASLATVIGVVGMLTTPAAADHTHSKEVRPGVCVLIRNHNHNGVHAHLHKGRAGQNHNIGVHGTASDPCVDGGRYLNG